MNYINLLLAALTTAVICGCGEPTVDPAAAEESSIKDAVRRNLKDPESAKFGPITIGTQNSGYTIAACATVNAKNSMGGYTGNQQAYLRKEGGNWNLEWIREWAHTMCISDFGK